MHRQLFLVGTWGRLSTDTVHVPARDFMSDHLDTLSHLGDSQTENLYIALMLMPLAKRCSSAPKLSLLLAYVPASYGAWGLPVYSTSLSRSLLK